MYRPYLYCLLLSCSLTVFANENVWIIGGGPNPQASQAQIEFNVKWVIASLKQLTPDATLHIFYANGGKSGKAVTEWREPVNANTSLQPLARVFGKQRANGFTFREKTVPDVEGSTHADVLEPALQQGFAKLRPGDRALIIYNGHGLADHDDAAGNTLRLWRDSRLSVRQFEKLLGSFDPAVPVRFVLTQCFAGGFARAIHPDAKDVLELAPGKRCGFFAVSKDREAEGCSPSVDVGDYRDYTTYFFAALTGQTRLGTPIKGQPDLNTDGVVTLYEAHLYALAEAENADIPQATSELFLDRWQPWYLRWLQVGALPDNVYGRLARALALKNELPEEGNRLSHKLDERRSRLHQQVKVLKSEQATLKSEVVPLQNEIRNELSYKWPAILHPYTAAFVQLMATDVDSVQDFILKHPSYQVLVNKQDQIEKIELQLLQLNRGLAQLDKILRLRLLARELDQFERLASKQVKADYARLLECEQLPL